MKWLQSWYHEKCDGSWEHSYGIDISTIDNPGWRVFINLNETSLENKPFEKLSVQRKENDWIICKIENSIFKGVGGPQNLTEILSVFQEWCK